MTRRTRAFRVRVLRSATAEAPGVPAPMYRKFKDGYSGLVTKWQYDSLIKQGAAVDLDAVALGEAPEPAKDDNAN